MFRVTVNLEGLIHSGAQNPSAAKDRRGDWAHELTDDQPHLTREELCETFADKAWCKEAIKRRDHVA